MTTCDFDNFHQAIIQIPTGEPSGRKQRLPCRYRGMEGRRLIVEAEKGVAPGTVISIECDDSLFLGEVITCSQLPCDLTTMQVRVEQVLTGLQSLMALRSRLLDEGAERVPSTLRLVPAGARN